MGKISRILL